MCRERRVPGMAEWSRGCSVLRKVYLVLSILRLLFGFLKNLLEFKK